MCSNTQDYNPKPEVEDDDAPPPPKTKIGARGRNRDAASIYDQGAGAGAGAGAGVPPRAAARRASKPGKPRSRAGAAGAGGAMAADIPAATRRLVDRLAEALARRSDLRVAAEAARGSGKRLLLSPERCSQVIVVH